jgi:hypothetical protein
LVAEGKIEKNLKEVVMEEQKIKAEKVIRSKGGRPQKKIKRCHIYMIRLTDLEQFTIATKAKNAGTSISDFFRKSAQKAKVVSRLTTEEAGHMRVLGGMANNLNQLTRLAHLNGLLSVQRNCRLLMAEINELLKKIIGDDRESDYR